MAEDNSFDIDTFYTERHKRLDRIALFANILTWVALIIGALAAIAHFIQTKTFLEFQIQARMMGGQTAADFAELLAEEDLLTISLFVEMFNIFFKGLVYAVILKAISLTLYMVIEIDLNIAESQEEEMNV